MDICGICGDEAESQDECDFALYFDGVSNFVDLTNTTIAMWGNSPRTISARVKTSGNNTSGSYDAMKIISTGTAASFQAFNVLINPLGVINVLRVLIIIQLQVTM